MLFSDNVMTDREAEPGAFAGGQATAPELKARLS